MAKLSVSRGRRKKFRDEIYSSFVISRDKRRKRLSSSLVIKNDSQWTAFAALPASSMSGKVIELRGSFSRLSLSGKSPVSKMTVRTASGTTIPGIDLTNVSNIKFDVDFQMTGWPYSAPNIVSFVGGSFDKISFEDCSFRHGYGSSLVDFDPTNESYPEVVRVANVLSAIATSSRSALSFQDSSATSACIEFFNRGSAPVHYRLGNSSVVAVVATLYSTVTTYVTGDVVYRSSDGTTYEALQGSTNIPVTNTSYWLPVGKRADIGTSSWKSLSFNPQTTTHIAVISESGTQQVNARTEIGLTQYLADCFTTSGGVTMGDIRILRCFFRDVSNGIKTLGSPSLIVCMDNDFRRIYQDNITVGPAPSGSGYFFRNMFSAPFARSGIAENLTGDARDPHGDCFQMVGSSALPGTIGPVYSGGNRCRRGARRTGVTSQGLFWKDNNSVPGYKNVFSISDTMLAGSANGFHCGEPGYPAGDLLIYGATVLDTVNLSGGNSGIRINTDGNYTVAVSHSIAQAFSAEDQPFVTLSSLLLSSAASASAVFPSISGLPSAISRAEIEAAVTSAAEGLNLGAVATSNAINWTTKDFSSVLLWDNIPSGVSWADLTNQTVSVVNTLPLRKVLNRKSSQTVVPGTGVEWRKVDTDKITELLAWTTSSGSVAPDQYIQIRKTNSASSLTALNFDITINGFLSRTVVTTASGAPSIYHIQSGTGPYFRDPSNATPANTTRLEFEANFYPTANPAANVIFFNQESVSCDITILTSGIIRLSVKDGANLTVVSNVNASQSITANQWQKLNLDVDQVAGTAILKKNDVQILAASWTPGASPFFQTGREICFFGTTAGLSLCPSGWNVEYAECYMTTSGSRTLRKRISGNAATVNADSWKLGGSAT